MKDLIHRETAKSHFEIAQEYDQKRESEEDVNKKVAYMAVAAQNYFYCSINVIEYILSSEKGEHSFSHENRFRKVKEYSNIFPAGFVDLYEKVDRDLRNKVAYRGQNSEKYELIKRLAGLAVKLL